MLVRLEGRIGKSLAAAALWLPLLQWVYFGIDFMGNAEWAMEKAPGLFAVLRGSLAWTTAIPPWVVVGCLLYVFFWVVFGRQPEGLNWRPRLFLESRDDGERHEPKGQQFILDNSGDLDALNVLVSAVSVRNRKIAPTIIRRIKARSEAEVRCDVEFGGGRTHDYNKSFAEALASGFRTLDVVGGPDRDRCIDGTIHERVRVTHSDEHGRQYSDEFLIRFWWGPKRFEAVERCKRPTRWERLRLRLPWPAPTKKA